jgi:hypothetical protein
MQVSSGAGVSGSVELSWLRETIPTGKKTWKPCKIQETSRLVLTGKHCRKNRSMGILPHIAIKKMPHDNHDMIGTSQKNCP